MFDHRLRPLIEGPLTRAARLLVAAGVTADGMTIGSCVLGILGAVAIASGAAWLGLLLLLAGRIGDGLDGAVARATTGPSDRGGYLDISLDFIVYAAVPLSFAIRDPAANGLAAAALLASFLINGSAFLAFAVMAERRSLTTNAQGLKSLYYLAGLMEGGETIAFFCLFCLLPGWFPILAAAMALLCVTSGLARIVVAARALS